MDDSQWRRNMQSVLETILLQNDDAFPRIGAHIAGLIQAIDPLMADYCRKTCPTCPDVCCNGRNVFFNRTDLIYLAAIGETAVPGQTRSQEGMPCRYLGREGCRLSRRVRPYVCVWFLCEPQMELLQGEPPRFQRNFLGVLQEIRHARLLLEALYEERSTGCSLRNGPSSV